jgi:putative glycosyltransferase (TIGR04372 family)
VDVFTAYGLGYKFPLSDERVLAGLVKLVSIVYPKFVYVDARHFVYKTLSQAPTPLMIGSESSGALMKTRVDHTGLYYLYQQNIGQDPSLRPDDKAAVETVLSATYPTFFDKPFVCLHLRGKVGEGLSSSVRNPGDHGTYKEAVQYLVDQGFHVLGAGETDHDVFSDIQGYFPLPKANCQEALNLYSLMYPALFVGQQSGPLLIPSARNIPSVITENFPYRVGTLRSRDIVLFKPIYIDGKCVRPKAVFNECPEVAYGGGFAQYNATVGVNEQADITSAVTQAVEHILRGKAYSEDQQKKIDHFRSAYRNDMLIYTYNNVPALCQTD